MRKDITALTAALLLLPVLATAARADERGGNSHGCVNPAGHVRGSCKKSMQGGYTRSGNLSTITGVVAAVNGDVAQFREDNGADVIVNQGALLNAGMGLAAGTHYSLHGYWNNNMFVAQAGGGDAGNPGRYPGGYPGNGYPYPGSSTSVQGVITAVSGSRITIMQGLFSSITINDEQALNNGAAQNLYVGRSITAYGYWSGGTFYATSIG